jgi:hypothetical protein
MDKEDVVARIGIVKKQAWMDKEIEIKINQGTSSPGSAS